VEQEITQTIPGVESPSAFNNEPTIKAMYQTGYAKSIGITDTATDGTISYKTGCSVDAFASSVRRAEMKVKYSSVVSDASGVDTTVASQGVTDTSSFVAAVAAVKAADPTAYASVTAPTTNDIASIAAATSVVISGGTVAPTSGAPGSGQDDSDLDIFIIIVVVVGAAIVIGLLVMLGVKIATANSNATSLEKSAQNEASTPAQSDGTPGTQGNTQSVGIGMESV